MALRQLMFSFLARNFNGQTVNYLKARLMQKFIWNSPADIAKVNRNVRIQRLSPPLRWSAISLASAATGYAVYKKQQRNAQAQTELSCVPASILTRLPNVKISKRIISPHDHTKLQLVLFQRQGCPYCSQVRVFLDYMGLSYSLVEMASPQGRQLKWSTHKKLPLLLLHQSDGSSNYMQIWDASMIISLLSTYLLQHDATDATKLVQQYASRARNQRVDGKQRHDIRHKDTVQHIYTLANSPSERKWCEWVDNYLVHLISPNCYRSLNEALETFKWFSLAGDWQRHFPNVKQHLMVYGGAIIEWFAVKILKKHHNLTGDVRLHMYEALREWHAAALHDGQQQFAGGERPNNADLAVYGLLCSVEGSRLFRDCLINTQIGDWYYRMQHLVKQHAGAYEVKRIKEQCRKNQMLEEAN